MIEEILAGFPIAGLAVALTLAILGVVAFCVYVVSDLHDKYGAKISMPVSVVIFLAGFLALCYIIGIG